MKKLLLLLPLLAACSKESECECKQAQYLNSNRTGYYYVSDVPLDCDTDLPTRNAGGGTFIRCVE